MRLAYLSPFLFALLLAGCGADEDERSVPEQTPPTREETTIPAVPGTPALPVTPDDVSKEPMDPDRRDDTTSP